MAPQRKLRSNTALDVGTVPEKAPSVVDPNGTDKTSAPTRGKPSAQKKRKRAAQPRKTVKSAVTIETEPQEETPAGNYVHEAILAPSTIHGHAGGHPLGALRGAWASGPPPAVASPPNSPPLSWSRRGSHTPGSPGTSPAVHAAGTTHGAPGHSLSLQMSAVSFGTPRGPSAPGARPQMPAGALGIPRNLCAPSAQAQPPPAAFGPAHGAPAPGARPQTLTTALGTPRRPLLSGARGQTPTAAFNVSPGASAFGTLAQPPAGVMGVPCDPPVAGASAQTSGTAWSAGHGTSTSSTSQGVSRGPSRPGAPAQTPAAITGEACASAAPGARGRTPASGYSTEGDVWTPADVSSQTPVFFPADPDSHAPGAPSQGSALSYSTSPSQQAYGAYAWAPPHDQYTQLHGMENSNPPQDGALNPAHFRTGMTPPPHEPATATYSPTAGGYTLDENWMSPFGMPDHAPAPGDLLAAGALPASVSATTTQDVPMRSPPLPSSLVGTFPDAHYMQPESRAPSTASGRPLRPAAAVPTPKKTGGRPPRPQAQDRSSSMAPAPTKKAGRPSNQQIDHTRTLLARSSAKPVASSARGRAGGAATLKAPGRPPRSAARKQVKAQSQDILVQAGALPPAAAPPPAPHGGGITTMPAPPTAATRTPAPRAPLNVVQPAAPTVARAALIARPQGEMGRKTNNNGSRIGFSGQEVLGLTDGLWHSAIDWTHMLCYMAPIDFNKPWSGQPKWKKDWIGDQLNQIFSKTRIARCDGNWCAMELAKQFVTNRRRYLERLRKTTSAQFEQAEAQFGANEWYVNMGHDGADDEVDGANDEVDGADDEVDGADDEVDGTDDEDDGADDEDDGTNYEVDGANYEDDEDVADAHPDDTFDDIDGEA